MIAQIFLFAFVLTAGVPGTTLDGQQEKNQRNQRNLRPYYPGGFLCRVTSIVS